MVNTRNFFPLSILFATVLAITGCNKNDDDNKPTQNVVEFVANTPDYSMLAEAVSRAGLTSLLSGPGPFTVFAPNNAAFQQFLTEAGTGTIENTPADVLATILTNHVVGGKFESRVLTNSYGSTLNESTFKQGVYTTMYINADNGLMVNGVAKVTTADIAVTNGVIHAVDKVIPIPTLVTFVTADPSFSLLKEALTTDGLATDFVAALSGPGPYTVFAPVDGAFQTLLNSNPDWNTIADLPKDLLDKVLRYHVISGSNVRSEDLTNGQQVNTMAGQTFTINLSGAGASIEAGQNTANIIFTDIQAGNGVLHVIDSVILPE